jgi:hypothetical protein
MLAFSKLALFYADFSDIERKNAASAGNVPAFCPGMLKNRLICKMCWKCISTLGKGQFGFWVFRIFEK